MVRCYSMDSILTEHGIDEIDLLKVDIEGAESQLFGAGCESWLGRSKRIYMELHGDKRVDEILKAHGFVRFHRWGHATSFYVRQ